MQTFFKPLSKHPRIFSYQYSITDLFTSVYRRIIIGITWIRCKVFYVSVLA